jgi:hypothetical protein
MFAGFRRLSIGIMWYVEVMVRAIFIQRPMLHDVVVAGVGCDFNNRCGQQVSPTPKCSDQCWFEVCVRPEDGYNVSQNMSLM